MSLWLCIRFPQLPLESLSKEHERPVVIIDRQRVIAANDAAFSKGIRSGQSHQTASALLESRLSQPAFNIPLINNSVQFIERDNQAEQAAIERLQSWAYSVTPTLELWHNDCLQLELGSCLTLYRGIDDLLTRIEQDLIYRGYYPRFGVASNRRAAWLLSYSDSQHALDYHQPLDSRLAALPIDLIKEDPHYKAARVIDNLHKVGIQTFSALLQLPSNTLGRRCGKGIIDWLKAVRSEHDDARRDFIPPAEFNDTVWFGFAIRNNVELQPAIKRLLDSLHHYLVNIQRVCDVIEWHLLPVRGEALPLRVLSSEAHRSAQRWSELSLLQLERLTIPEDIEGLGLYVNDLQEPSGQADDLFSERLATEPLHNIVDRIRSRLGLQAVNQLALRDAHLPEDSLYASYSVPDVSPFYNQHAQRPFWLMAEPQPARQQQGKLYWNGPLELLHGPERIEDNWWQQPVSRDYYIAQQENGQPLWLYQDRHTRLWYVHGILP